MITMFNDFFWEMFLRGFVPITLVWCGSYLAFLAANVWLPRKIRFRYRALIGLLILVVSILIAMAYYRFINHLL